MTAHTMTFMWLWRNLRHFRDSCECEAAYDRVPHHYYDRNDVWPRGVFFCYRLELADCVAAWGELNRRGNA